MMVMDPNINDINNQFFFNRNISSFGAAKLVIGKGNIQPQIYRKHI